MKARPRAVENRVADAMNEHFKKLTVSPVERIPVLGRTGPDITLNELGIVVDVKSRKEVPSSIFFPMINVFRFDLFHAVRLQNLDQFWVEWDSSPQAFPEPPMLDFASKMIRDYLAHMEEWTHEHAADGVSCVVLHRPEMPIGSSVAVIYSSSRRRLIEYARRYTVDSAR
jgi:hypothetical protein